MEKILIIEIPYAGLGDHIFHSHLPRIAKECNGYDKVYISNLSPVRHLDYKRIVWEYNPYIDGFVDEPGKTCDIHAIVAQFKNHNCNLLDLVMLSYGLDNGKTWNEPEIYYQPKFRPEFNKVVYDPNFLSWVGDVVKEEAQKHFDSKGYVFDAIMKIRSEKHLVLPDRYQEIIETPTLEDFCDLIFSTEKLYCLTSGTATLAAGLGKPVHVFYGFKQSSIFQHSKLHTYEQFTPPFKKRIKHFIYKLINKK